MVVPTPTALPCTAATSGLLASLIAGSHEWDLQFIGCARQQDHVRDVVLARMAATLESVDADGIAADFLGLQRMPHRGAFVDHLDAGCFQRRHELLRTAARGFHDLHAAIVNGGDIFRIGRRAKSW
jgi:hypothetical protein